MMMFGPANTKANIAKSTNGDSTSADMLCYSTVRKGNSKSFYCILPTTIASGEIREFGFYYDIGMPSIIKF